MKKHTSLLLGCLVALLATSCMNEFDDLSFEPGNYPYGNNSIGEANTTISQLKEKYSKYYLSSQDGVVEIKDSIRIRGRVITNDESGNVYKQFAIQDETGGIIIGVNATGTYAYLPVGQEVIIDCQGLHFGGYRKLPQIGALFNGSIGRMNENVFKKHIKLVGSPDASSIMKFELSEEWLKDSKNKDYNVPLYVHMTGVKFQDGGKPFAPTDDVTENRSVKIGSQEVVFRMSSYANFALDTIPSEPVNVTGVLTRYNNTWQCLLRVLDDIEPTAK